MRARLRARLRARARDPASAADASLTLSLVAPSPPAARAPPRRLCLSIFLVLVYARGLAWEFSAEVATILLVELALVALTLSNRNGVLPIWKAAIAAALFPGSLLFVWVLENVFGLV